MTRPSGYSDDGGRYATAFMKPFPCDEIVSSKFGGGPDIWFQTRTVPSLEAEMTAFADGNVTARTYKMNQLDEHGYGLQNRIIKD